ncbi:MAG: cation:proton antiporter [Casimicrobiaceae bacterium]
MVLAAALVATLVGQTRLGARAPVGVLQVVMGVLVGPHVLGWIAPDPFLSRMVTVGTSALLFMAGMEIDFGLIRGRPLTLALGGWIASAAVALAAVGLLHIIPDVHAPLMISIALTTTSLGVLLPALRDAGRLATLYGRLLLAAGSLGEVAPIVAAALVLSQRYTAWNEFGFLLLFLGLVGVAVAVGIGARPPRVLAALQRTLRASTQIPVLLVLVIAAAFVALADEWGLEGILGAFAAGIIVGLSTRDKEAELFRDKLDAVMFGFLTPFFWVGTGIQFDVTALTRDVPTMLLVPTFLLLLLLVRGATVFLYLRDLSKAERLPFALSLPVASLGIVVVITQIGTRAQGMNPDVAQALIGAAVLSVLVYPTLAGIMLSRAVRSAPRDSA